MQLQVQKPPKKDHTTMKGQNQLQNARYIQKSVKP